MRRTCEYAGLAAMPAPGSARERSQAITQDESNAADGCFSTACKKVRIGMRVDNYAVGLLRLPYQKNALFFNQKYYSYLIFFYYLLL